MNEQRIRQIINEELTKAEVESMISRKIDSSYNSREFEKVIKDITAKVIENLFKTLWNRSSSWKGGAVQ